MVSVYFQVIDKNCLYEHQVMSENSICESQKVSSVTRELCLQYMLVYAYKIKCVFMRDQYTGYQCQYMY